MSSLKFRDLDIRPGVLLSKKDYRDFGCIVATPSSLFVDHFSGNTCISRDHIKATGKGEKSDYIRKGDILLIVVGDVGRFYLIKKNFPIPVVVNHSMVVIKKSSNISLLKLFEEEGFVSAFTKAIKKIAIGKVIPRLTLNSIKELYIKW